MSLSRSVHANILAGPDVKVVEMARASLLIESDVRLTPGAGICLNVTLANENHLAGGRITRVDASLVSGQVKYRAGVALDTEIPAFDGALDVPSTAKVATPAPAADDPEEQHMDSSQQQQLLKTALRTSEAHRKQLSVEFDEARAAWERERHDWEQKIAAAERHAADATKQVTAAREAERLLAGKYAKDQGAWTKERQGLEDAVKQAGTQTAKLTRDLEAATANERQSSERHAAAEKAWITEKQTLQAAVAQRDAQAKQTAAEKQTLQATLAQRDAQAKQADAEKQTLQATLAQRDAQVKQADAEKRDLTAKVKAIAGELDTLRDEQERLTKALAAADDKIARHEQERSGWTTQKERLSSRLQLTEQWCADQQDLLYQLRQQMEKAFTLVDGWKPPAELEKGERQRKASA